MNSPRRCPTLPEGVLVLLFGLAAAGAAGQPLPTLLIPACATAALAALCIPLLHEHRTPGVLRRQGGFLLVVLTTGLLFGLYLANPTHRTVDGVGLLPRSHVPWLPGSAWPAGTRAALETFLPGAAVLGWALHLTPRPARRLLILWVFFAVGMAVLVWIQRLSPRPFPVFPYTGLFVSENHYAAFANLAIPPALALAARVSITARHHGAASSPAPVFLFGAALLAGSVLLSRSRAGLAVTLLLLAAAGLIALSRFRERAVEAPTPSRGRLARGGLGMGCLVAVGLLALGSGSLPAELAFRGRVLLDTLHIALDHPLWGTGPGTFRAVFPYFQSDALGDLAFRHAHSEPVQLLAEWGFGGSLLLLVVWILWAWRSRPRPTAAPRAFGLERGALWFALAGSGLHSLVDFTYRHPLIFLSACLLAGGALGEEAATEEGDS